MLSLLTGAVLSGLAGAPHCTAMCGGFAIAASARRGEGAAWHAGRLTTYMILGALAGAAGGRIAGPGVIGRAVIAGLLVVFCGHLAGLIHLPSLLPARLVALASRLLARPGRLPRLGFGLLTGLLPCGLVYAAIGLALVSGSALQGAGVMLAFGLTTVPTLAVASVGMRRILFRFPRVRPLMAVGVLVMGLSALAARTPTTADQLPSCHVVE
ncbi:MAG: sulfite exporter TauE/SafE [Myxococcota bacterium]|jgi:sulfite exporter TauE/SafE